jgi:HEAT repeat protein
MRALGILGNPRAVEPLIAAMKGEDIWAYELRETAAEALRAITGAGFGADPEEWQKWWDEKKERFIKEKQKEEVQK